MTIQQKIKVNVSTDYSKSELKAISQDVIDYIIKRTKDGKDYRNKNFPKYSKAYENSLNFKIAGKNKGQLPDLTLTGDMLAMLDTLSINKGQIEIGYPAKDDTLNGKVEGNRIGSYGRPKGNKKIARDFLGITNADLKNEILINYPLKDKEIRAERTKIINKLIKEGATYQDKTILSQEED